MRSVFTFVKYISIPTNAPRRCIEPPFASARFNFISQIAAYRHINTLPNGKILDCSKLKPFADEKII